MAASSFYIRRAFSSTRLYKNLKVQDINWVKVAMKSINIAMKNNNAAMKHNDSAMKHINIAMDAERKYHAEYKVKSITIFRVRSKTYIVYLILGKNNHENGPSRKGLFEIEKYL